MKYFSSYAKIMLLITIYSCLSMASEQKENAEKIKNILAAPFFVDMEKSSIIFDSSNLLHSGDWVIIKEMDDSIYKYVFEKYLLVDDRHMGRWTKSPIGNDDNVSDVIDVPVSSTLIGFDIASSDIETTSIFVNGKTLNVLCLGKGDKVRICLSSEIPPLDGIVEFRFAIPGKSLKRQLIDFGLSARHDKNNGGFREIENAARVSE